MYPQLRIEDIEVAVESLSRNKGKVNIDEFIDFMSSHPESTTVSMNSREYQAILALKAQRRILPNDYMNYFEKISDSVLYMPSYISTLHSETKNLPSESFRLAHDSTGIWYEDVKPVIVAGNKPVQHMQMVEPSLAAYLIAHSATGVPIPNPDMLRRENIVNRVVKVGFFNNQLGRIVHGTCFLQAEWEEENEDIWKFNSIGDVGTNPLVCKWSDKDTEDSIDILFEFVSSIKYCAASKS